MRLLPKTAWDAAPIATTMILIGMAAGSAVADEPQGGSRIARLFRLGGGSSSTSSTQHSHDGMTNGPTRGTKPTADVPTTVFAATPSPTAPPSTPDVSTGMASPRISPMPRVSRPPTEADPIVTRVALGRSDGGSQFATFLQVYADGTVLDTEGVHKVGPEAMKPLLEALRQGELYRSKGHCGAPSTDFVELAHVVVYERSYGKLKATAFSYSGNPQGCDPSIKHLHVALEALQTKLMNTAAPAPAAPSHASTPRDPVGHSGAPVLGLTGPTP